MSGESSSRHLAPELPLIDTATWHGRPMTRPLLRVSSSSAPLRRLLVIHCTKRVLGAMRADPTPQTVVMRDGRSAGFGFVDFSDDQAAKTAIEEMNNSE